MSVTKRLIGQPAVISLGANLGDRQATLLSATRELAETDGVELTAISPVIETAALRPSGVDHSAPAYLNAVALITTTLTPEALLDVLTRIEHAHGRIRAERWGDRTLDLDLVDFAGMVSSSDRLTLPHHDGARTNVTMAQADFRKISKGTAQFLHDPAQRV